MFSYEIFYVKGLVINKEYDYSQLSIIYIK